MAKITDMVGPDVIEEARKRLRRIEGQVRGLQKMLEDGRDCEQLITQIAAVNRALEATGFRLVAAGARTCITDPKGAAEDGLDIESVERMFMKLS